MNKTKKITIYNQTILKALKEKYPSIWKNIKYKNKEKWITKEAYPTYKQLVEISKAFRIPFGYLFLNSLPEKKLPITHYRTLNKEPFETLIQKWINFQFSIHFNIILWE